MFSTMNEEPSECRRKAGRIDLSPEKLRVILVRPICRMKLVSIVALAALCQSALAFNFVEMERKRKSVRLSAVNDGDSRRGFISKAGAAAFSVSSGIGFDLLTPLPANAVGGLEKVNAQLKA